MYSKADSDYSPSAAAIESPASIKVFNTNLAKNSADYEPTINYNTNTQTDNNPINLEEETPLMLDNSRLADEDEYNSNAIRRSRLASSPLNSIMIDRQKNDNFFGEEVCGKPISKPTSRIIGGQDAYYAEFPWMTHIKSKYILIESG